MKIFYLGGLLLTFGVGVMLGMLLVIADRRVAAPAVPPISLPPDYRAYTIRVHGLGIEQRSQLPGSRVDLLAVFHDDLKVKRKKVMKTLLEDVLVLAIEPSDVSRNSSDIGLITFALPPEHVGRVAWAAGSDSCYIVITRRHPDE